MSPLKLHIAVKLDTGRVRSTNEDSAMYHYPPKWPVLLERGVLLVIADGVGSLKSGEMASYQAVTSLIDRYYDLSRPFSSVKEHLYDVIGEVNTSLYNQRESLGATTLVAAVVKDQEVIYTHIGDSRLYWLGISQREKSSPVEQLTQDHVQPVLQADGRTKMKLTQALGYAPKLTLKLSTRPFRQGESLLLATDGITRYLDAEQLGTYYAASSDAHAFANRLVDVCNQAGGVDNIGVLVVTLGEPLINAKDLEMHISSLMLKPHPSTSQSPSPSFALQSSSSPSLRQDSLLRPISLIWGVLAIAVVLGAIIYGQIFQESEKPSPSTDTLDISLTVTDNPPSPSEMMITPASQLQDEATLSGTSSVQEITETVVIQFERSGRTYTRINGTVVAFILNTDDVYERRDSHTLPDGKTWIRVFDTRNDRYGWIEASKLPPYHPVDG